MGEVHRRSRSQVALEAKTSIKKFNPSKRFPHFGQICRRNGGQGSRSTFQWPRSPEPPLLTAKERYRQVESHTQLVTSQPTDPLSIVQDGIGSGGQDEHTTRCVAHLHRPEGRLLARPYRGFLPEVPGLRSPHARRAELLRVPGNAIRPEYSTTHIHQAVRGASRLAEGEGGGGLRLSRRLVGSRGVGKGVSGGHCKSDEASTEVRLHPEPIQVPPSAHSVHRVARVDLVLKGIDHLLPCGQGSQPDRKGRMLLHADGNIKDPAGVLGRFSKLGHHNRPNRQDPTEGSGQASDKSGQEISENRQKEQTHTVPDASSSPRSVVSLESTSSEGSCSGMPASHAFASDCD